MSASRRAPTGLLSDIDDSRMRHGREVNGRFQYDADRVRSQHDPYVREHLVGARVVDAPEFRVMGGGPASGKSSLIKNRNVQLPPGHVLANADEAKDALQDYRTMVKAGDPRAAAFVHEESSDMAKRLTAESLRAGHTTVLDGTGDGAIESLAGKIATARANGAQRVIGDYVTVAPDEAVRRATLRAAGSGRVVPETVIRGTHTAVSDTFRQAADRDLFDELRLFDNNGDAPRLIYQRIEGVETILDPPAYSAFLSYGAG